MRSGSRENASSTGSMKKSIAPVESIDTAAQMHPSIV